MRRPGDWFNTKNDFAPGTHVKQDYLRGKDMWQWRLPVQTEGRPEHYPVPMGVLNIKSNMRGIVLREDDTLTLAIEGDDLVGAK